MPDVIIPLPEFHPKQQIVFDSKASEILLGGDTRGGKSFFIRKTYIVLCSQIPGLLTDIFRLNYADVKKNYMEGETSFPVLLANWEKAGLCVVNQDKITFWNESVISLEHCSDDSVMQKHQGVARHVRTLEESAQMLERRVRALSGWVTMSDEMMNRVPDKWKGTFPRLYHSTNPIGPCAGYYRKNFVQAREPYVIEQVGQFKRQYIPFRTDDNPSEDAERTRARIKEAFPDPATQRALLECSWDASVGDFFKEWDAEKHVVDDIPGGGPAHLFHYGSFDWGTSDPACALFWFIADGEAFEDAHGIERWFPRGALVCYRELYFCNPLDPTKGSGIRNEDMADSIKGACIYPQEKNLIFLTDSLPHQDRGGPTIAAIFMTRGVYLKQGDTNRVAGWSQIRSRLIGKKIDSNDETSTPMIYFVRSCKYVKEYVPALMYHKTKPQDAEEIGEATHVCDTIRYGVASRPRTYDAPEGPTIPRKEIKANDISFKHALKQVQQVKLRVNGRGY